jgi:hypothetical protein
MLPYETHGEVGDQQPSKLTGVQSHSRKERVRYGELWMGRGYLPLRM